MPRNVQEGISIKDPASYSERADVAGHTCSLLHINVPCLVDTMTDTVNRAYAAWPDRLYIIDPNGRIALMGDQGPKGFAPSVALADSWLAQSASNMSQRSTKPQ